VAIPIIHGAKAGLKQRALQQRHRLSGRKPAKPVGIPAGVESGEVEFAAVRPGWRVRVEGYALRGGGAAGLTGCEGESAVGAVPLLGQG